MMAYQGQTIVNALIPEVSEEIRATSPPWPLQRALAAVLGPVARARGLQAAIELD